MTWTTAFLATLALVAVLLGGALAAAPRLLPLPLGARFASGVALAPQLVGFALLMVFATLPGLPWPAVHAVLGLLALALALPARRGLTLVLRRLGRSLRRPRPAAWLAVLAVLAFGLVIVRLQAINASVPLIAFDALQYTREAMRLGAARDIAAWVGHAGTPDGVFRGDIHHPVYPGFLAWALQFAPHPGYPADHALRWAFQATFLAMLVSLPVIGLALRWRWWAFAAVPLVLLVPQFDYVSSSASRDAFRIVPVVILCGLLLRAGALAQGWRGAARFAPAVLALAVLALTAHTLDGFVLVGLLAGWAAWQLLAGRLAAWILLPAAGLGLLLGSWTYADAWLATGDIHGHGVLMYGALEGTPMLQVIRDIEQASARGVVAPLARLREALVRDARGVALAGVLVALVVLVHACLAGRRWRGRPATGAALIALVAALPVLGAFDLAGYQVSQWFVTNTRYALHWYVLLAVAVLAPLAVGARLPLANAGRLVLLLALCLGGWYFTLQGWYRNTWPAEYVDRRLEPVRAGIAAIGGRRLLLEDARWNYYLGERHVVMYASPTRALFLADTDERIDAALRDLGVAGLLLGTSSLQGWWSHAPLLGYLERHACRLDLKEPGQSLFLLPRLSSATACDNPKPAGNAPPRPFTG